MSDGRDKQYEEYLALREKSSRERASREASSGDGFSAGQPHGADYSRQEQVNYEQRAYEQAYQSEAERARQRQEYLNARESGSSQRREKEPKRKKYKKGRSGFRIFAMLVLMIILAAGGLAGGAFAITKAILDNMGTVEIDQDNIGINYDVDQDLSQYRNIAVLGIDSRDMNDDEDARSDSIIIASIDKETNEIKMFSVYRDTMLDLSGLADDLTLDKVTHAYYYGKAEGALKTLNRNLDLNIREVVVVNWKAVADTVDAVGGVEVEIEEAEMNEMNKFIHETSKKTGLTDEDIDITETGKQTLNGVQAVTYARIRKDAVTGDYRRNERMKIVVKAVFNKAKTPNFEMIKTVATVVLPEIKTNMSSTDIMEMVIKLGDYKMEDTTTGWPYDVGEWVGAAWYGPPRTLYTNVVKLHENFFDQEDYIPTEEVQNISQSIANLTGIY